LPLLVELAVLIPLALLVELTVLIPLALLLPLLVELTVLIPLALLVELAVLLHRPVGSEGLGPLAFRAVLLVEPPRLLHCPAVGGHCSPAAETAPGFVSGPLLLELALALHVVLENAALAPLIRILVRHQPALPCLAVLVHHLAVTIHSFLVHHHLAVLLHAPPSDHRSFLALDAALLVPAGEPFLVAPDLLLRHLGLTLIRPGHVADCPAERNPHLAAAEAAAVPVFRKRLAEGLFIPPLRSGIPSWSTPAPSSAMPRSYPRRNPSS
jgi:hypothetical protein